MTFLRYINTFHRWLFPRACALCQKPSQRDQDLCESCETQLPWLHHVCRNCASPLPETHQAEQLICGACISRPPPFQSTIALWHYQGCIKTWISRMKFNRKLIYPTLMGKLMAQYIKTQLAGDELPQVLIPVPLHKQRLRQRGFNQALEIAKPLSKALNIPLNYRCCQRIFATPPQSSLPAIARVDNVRNAFKAKALKLNHVAIVDDVVTTGNTVAELTRALLLAGVERVDVWCCAKTTYTTVHNNIQKQGAKSNKEQLTEPT